jgi:putative transposase
VNRESARQNTVIGGVQLAQAAKKHWRRIDGQSQLPKAILGVKFTDGIEDGKEQVQTAA